jgi:hypothetical protein
VEAAAAAVSLSTGKRWRSPSPWASGGSLPLHGRAAQLGSNTGWGGERRGGLCKMGKMYALFSFIFLEKLCKQW